MHDTDRISTEYGAYESAAYEDAFEDSFEFTEESSEAVFDETDEVDLAAEMLDVAGEEELDQFLGKLLRKAASTVGGVMRSPVGQALGGMLKGAVRKHLPSVGGAIGGRFGGATGANIGRSLASKLAGALNLEESGEDMEFAAARKFVRFAGAAAGKAAKAAQAAGVDPKVLARRALIEAARRFAPGLLGETVAPPAAAASAPVGRGQSGRWIRRGARIVLLGV